jgi:hypothetical protein
MERSIVLVEKARLPAFLGFMEILVGVILLAQRKARATCLMGQRPKSAHGISRG